MADDAGDAAWSDVPVFGAPPEGVVATVRPSAYGLVSDGAGARLAVVRTPHGLFLPGGGIEPGEAPRDAVVREVREECGLEVRLDAWSARAVDFVWSPTERTHFEKRATFVAARVTGPGPAAVEPDHVTEWLAPERAAAALSHPSHRWAVDRWREGVER